MIALFRIVPDFRRKTPVTSARLPGFPAHHRHAARIESDVPEYSSDGQ